MYESFYGLKAKPFSLLPDPEFLYLGKKHKVALTLLEYALMNNAGFCVITGEIGAGKTTLLRRLLDSIEDNITVGMITNTHQSFGELLDWVLSAFGIHQPGLSKVEMHQRLVDFLLEQYAHNKTTLLIVDEAQNMPAATLEELRMLSNINSEKDLVLQVILAGQPELKNTLRKPELMQFAQRISVDYHLDALSLEETFSYIQHRLITAGATDDIFTPGACRLIHHYSNGVPRLINLLCDTALVYGFADQQKTIDVDLVEEMISERMENSILPLANIDKEKKPAGNDDDFPWINPEGGTQGLKPPAEKKTVEKAVSGIARVQDSATDESRQRQELVTNSADKAIGASSSTPSKPAVETKPELLASVENSQPATDLRVNHVPEPVLDEVAATAGAEERSDSDQADAVRKTGNMRPVGIVLVILLTIALLLSIAAVAFRQQPALPEEVQSKLTEVEKIKKDLVRVQQRAEAMQHERDAAIAKAKQEQEQREQQKTAALEAARREMEAAAAAAIAAEKVLQASRRAEQQEEKQRLEQAKLRAERKRLEQERKRAEVEAQRLAVERRLAELEKQRLATERAQADALAQQKQSPARADDGSNLATGSTVAVPEMQAAKEEMSFNADPCASPSAKFLSTCR
jgi:type II secretory pathway predicted ATPase ExeA